MDRCVESIEIVCVIDALCVPAVRLVTFGGIVAESESRISFDGDVIVVVESDQLAEPQVSGEGGCLVRHAFHHVTIAGDEVCVVIDDVVTRPIEKGSKLRFGDGHADCIPNTLSEWTGCRLDARSVAELGMPRRAAFPLTELLQVVEEEVVTGEIEDAVK